MKILITGYTTRMHGSQRIQGDYITFSFLLEDMLREMGHEVERRKVTVGEDLTYKYHFAFCGVAPLSSMTSGQVPQTHYAMEQMEGKHVVYADDWSFCGYGNSVKYALDRWEKYLLYKNFLVDSRMVEKARLHLERMMDAQMMAHNAPVLCPMFKWGDHEFLMRENYLAKLITVDPSAWVKFPDLTVPTFYNKRKQWVMAALSDHSRWVNKQGFQLPIKYVGNKRMGDGFVLTETETIRLFSDSFGILSCGYPSAGSGWWRSRYLNASWAESIIYSDSRDASLMGEAYQGKAEDFEAIDTPEKYEERVSGQREWLNANIASKEEVKQTIIELMR